MSVNIKQLDGTLKKIAGNTVILDATASEIREGVITANQIGTVEGEGYKTLEIQLSPAMPDTKYFVVFNGSTNSNFSVVAQRPETGKFYCTFRNTISTSVTADMDCHWYAVRLVELEGYTELQNKVSNPDSTPTENSTNLVTSGGVYDAIKNASSVFIGTSSEWESETSKTDYQVAILTDQPTVNAVDGTDGSTTVVANKNLVFKGTLDEWEALTTAEKKAYDEALIADDMDTGEVVDAVTDGDMRAVTSNAVAEALSVEILTPTKTANVGTIYEAEFLRMSRLVFVNLNLIVSSGILFTGLPKPTSRQTFTINGFYETDKALRLIVNTDGSIETDNSSAITNQNVGGHIVYIAAED